MQRCTHCDEPGYPRSYSFGVPLCDKHADTPADATPEEVANVDAGHIGYLIDSTHIRCKECQAHYNTKSEGCASLYRVNVGHYGQDCHECAKVLNIPLLGWPQLFSERDCKGCSRFIDNGPFVEMPCQGC